MTHSKFLCVSKVRTRLDLQDLSFLFIRRIEARIVLGWLTIVDLGLEIT